MKSLDSPMERMLQPQTEFMTPRKEPELAKIALREASGTRSRCAHAITFSYPDTFLVRRVVQEVLKDFLSKDFCTNWKITKDEHSSGLPVLDKVDTVLEKVEQNQHINSYDKAEEVEIDHKIVVTTLKKALYLGTTRAH
ncbi:hypothetical protein EVAR_31397_1 [Eumeta japonica]|uniref:Uncharacterized protein n=1 Tax=Eumeta variegata TaxID=151549 RepID=A0A4C1UZP9_EUMVA|nr:hypothetical protein EVAR_31397_1 [Eumeta japonica]